MLADADGRHAAIKAGATRGWQIVDLVGGRIGGELLPVVGVAAKAALLLPETVRIIRLCGDQIFQPLQPSRFKETEDDDDSHQHGSNQY
ncbi:hypothetical protein ACVWXM_007456 [Bradyrhizobium sp. GM7.3]